MSQPPGILPCQSLDDLIAQGAITSESPFDADQVQPASLDLRLGARVWRVRASFLPGRGRTVAERIEQVAMHELDLTKGAVLERGCVYIAELQEALALPKGISARANPKSSTGRVDVFVRLLTNNSIAFDDVSEGYAGPTDRPDRGDTPPPGSSNRSPSASPPPGYGDGEEYETQ